MKAWLNLRYTITERVAAFRSGLERLGYEVVPGFTHSPDDHDLLCTWNRIGAADSAARAFEARGLPVLVTENAAWGNRFAGADWYSLAVGRHNTAGRFPVGGPERWDAIGAELAPWRAGGEEVVILAQRSIGSAPVAMPRAWPDQARRQYGGRIRRHPGTGPARPLEDDLLRAAGVVTWGSGAAVRALMWGIPAQSDMPNWIGEQDNTDAGRLAMFRRLAWAQWTLPEIASGEPFRRLLA